MLWQGGSTSKTVMKEPEDADDGSVVTAPAVAKQKKLGKLVNNDVGSAKKKRKKEVNAEDGDECTLARHKLSKKKMATEPVGLQKKKKAVVPEASKKKKMKSTSTTKKLMAKVTIPKEESSDDDDDRACENDERDDDDMRTNDDERDDDEADATSIYPALTPEIYRLVLSSDYDSLPEMLPTSSDTLRLFKAMVSNMDKETLMKSGIIVAMVKHVFGDEGVMKLADLDEAAQIVALHKILAQY